MTTTIDRCISAKERSDTVFEYKFVFPSGFFKLSTRQNICVNTRNIDKNIFLKLLAVILYFDWLFLLSIV